MESKEEEALKVCLRQATDYEPAIKERVWQNIEKELFENQIAPPTPKRIRRRWRLGIGLAAVLVGGSVCAAPIIKSVKDYFGEYKTQAFYDDQSGEHIKTQAVLYESDLGYMTFYDAAYFDITKEDNKEIFTAKTGAAHGRIEIEKVTDKSYDELVAQYTDGELRMDNNSDEPQEICSQEAGGKTEAICLSDAKEMGVFKITIQYDAEDTLARGSCWYIKHQFKSLHAAHQASIEKGKPNLKFTYDTSVYELIRDPSMPDAIYLQKIDSDLREMEDILLSYEHSLDNPETCKQAEIANIEEERKWRKEAIEKETDSEFKKVMEQSMPSSIEEKNDLNIPALKLKEDYGNYYWDMYFIDDGRGGSFIVSIHDPKAETLQTLLDSIEIVGGEEEVMAIKEKVLGGLC